MGWLPVYQKELRETLRDRRTLIVMIVVPVLLYPVLLIASEQLALFGQRQLEEQSIRVGVVAPEDAFEGFVRSRQDVIPIVVADPVESVRQGLVDVAVVPGGAHADEMQVLYDAADDRSQRGRAVAGRLLGDWRDTVVARRLVEEGVSPVLVRPFEVSDSSVAKPSEVGGYALGRFLPMLLVMITLLGCFYPAIDMAAGEKERGTLEPLLMTPVGARQIVTGKFLAVATIGVFAALLNLVSMLLTFQTGLFQFGQALAGDFNLPWQTLVLIGVTLVPLAVLFSSLFLGIAVRARSFREAQNSLTPVYMMVMIPALLPLFPGIDLTPLLAVVPVAGVALFFREAMGGSATIADGALALTATGIWALLALSFAASSFGKERILFGVPEHDRPQMPGGDRRLASEPYEAFGFLAIVGVLFFYGGVRLQVAYGEMGLLLTEWGLLMGATVAFLVVRGLNPVTALSLRLPAPSRAFYGLILMLGAMPVAWFIAWAQSSFLPIPWEFLEGMEQILARPDGPRLAWLIFLMAVTPAICEEAVFRGALLSGTARRWPTWQVLAFNAVAFGAFHVSFETVVRFMPTAWLGLVLAYVVVRSRSLVLSAGLHFLNNATIVILGSRPELLGRYAEPDTPPPLWLFPIALLCLTMGVRGLEKGR